MNGTRAAVVICLFTAAGVGETSAQTSSLGAKSRQADAGRAAQVTLRDAPAIKRNAVYDRHSWISVPPKRPKTFRVGDLVTIIVREQRKFEADADLETKKRLNIKSDLDAFIKFLQGGVGAAEFRRGRPSIDYKFDNNLKTEGDTAREDRLTMRLTGKVIDVKPNGLLVLEASARVQHDDEISRITLTGTCRKEDVNADNTVLSTQIADKNVVVNNEGALKAASTRGWIPRLIDLIKPF